MLASITSSFRFIMNDKLFVVEMSIASSVIRSSECWPSGNLRSTITQIVIFKKPRGNRVSSLRTDGNAYSADAKDPKHYHGHIGTNKTLALETAR